MSPHRDVSDGPNGFLSELRLVRWLEGQLKVEPDDFDPDVHPIVSAASAVHGTRTQASAGTILTVDEVRTSHDIPWGQLEAASLPTDVRDLIRYVVTELVRNVEEHARAIAGASVRVSWRSELSRIGIGVADRGVGTVKSISRFHPVATDAEGLRLAVTPGISGATAKIGGNDRNAGAGLFFASRMCSLFGTPFLLVSGAAAWHLDPSSSEPGGSPIELPEGAWTGTAVGLDLPVRLDRTRKDLFNQLNSEYLARVKLEKDEFKRRQSLSFDP